MKTTNEIENKITALKQRLSELKKIHSNTDSIENDVTFPWYINSAVGIEKVRQDIKLLEWVLK